MELDLGAPQLMNNFDFYVSTVSLKGHPELEEFFQPYID